MFCQQEAWIGAEIKQTFAVPLSLRITDQACDLNDLTESERKQLAHISNGVRRQSWLKGRKALKLTQREYLDTSLLKFPVPNFSLTHSGDYALAIYLPNGRGIGLDFQIHKPIKAGIEKFFLTKNELSWLSKQPIINYQDHILRLWTLKEAVFKADLHQTKLKDYQVLNLGKKSGFIEKISESKSFKFKQFCLAAGSLSCVLAIPVGIPL